MDTSFMDRAGDIVGSHRYFMRTPWSDPMEGGNVSTEELGESATVEDDRSFQQASLEDGRRMIKVRLWLSHEGNNNETTSYTVLPDGSVSFVLGSVADTQTKALDVELNFFAREVDYEGDYSAEGVSKSIPLMIPVAPVIETKVVDAGGALVEGADVLVERVIFCLTPLGLHYELYFTTTPEQAKLLGPYFYLEFLNEQGERVKFGLTLRTYVKALDDSHFVQIGSLMQEKIPDTLILRGYSVTRNESYGQTTLKVK
jgi:hypothetical protein